jgi:hypothetical protein
MEVRDADTQVIPTIYKEFVPAVGEGQACRSACWYDGLGDQCYAFVYYGSMCYLLHPNADTSGSGLGSGLTGQTVEVHTKDGELFLISLNLLIISLCGCFPLNHAHRLRGLDLGRLRRDRRRLRQLRHLPLRTARIRILNFYWPTHGNGGRRPYRMNCRLIIRERALWLRAGPPVVPPSPVDRISVPGDVLFAKH